MCVLVTMATRLMANGHVKMSTDQEIENTESSRSAFEERQMESTGEGSNRLSNGEQQQIEIQTSRTSDFYRTKNLPERFERPELVQGYNTKSEHPMYKTTGSLYGSQAPTVHTVPTEFHGRCQKFSKYYGKFGMYRNHSLNTSTDSSRV